MHLSSIRIQGFKRFTDLQVLNLSRTARLIVLAGPNGSGKSSFFDALKVWHWYNGASSSSYGRDVPREDRRRSSAGWLDHHERG